MTGSESVDVALVLGKAGVRQARFKATAKEWTITVPEIVPPGSRNLVTADDAWKYLEERTRQQLGMDQPYLERNPSGPSDSEVEPVVASPEGEVAP